MDFQIDARLAEYQVCHLAQIIHARHGDPIQNLVLYKGPPSNAENKIATDSTDTMQSVGATTFYYDYNPPFDPFTNRPCATQLFSTNLAITLETFESGNPPTIVPERLKWSKTAEYSPDTVKRMAKEKAAAEEAARLKAEEEAAEKAAKEEKARLAAEAKRAEAAAKAEAKAKAEAAAAAAKEQEEKEKKAAAEAREKARLEALAKKDPEGAKRAAEEAAAKKAAEEAEAAKAAAKAEAEKKIASLPKRAKGGALGVFFGPTTKEHYGFDKLTKDNPYICVPAAKILAEIKDKGKISDMYVFKEKVEKYKGDPQELLFCIDPDELYGDNGMIACLEDADKQHFICHIAVGNGIPSEIK